MERNTPLAKRNPESGTAVFLSLFALAAVGYACLRLITQASGYTQILRIYENGLEHQNSLRASVSLPASPQRRCDIQKLSGGSILGVAAAPQDWHVCTTGQPGFFSNNQTISASITPDYAAILSRATPCQAQRTSISRTTFDTPFAPFTCHLPARLEAGVTVVENIAIADLVIWPTDPAQLITIATPGSLIAEASLTLATDTLILAGGDIKIPTLRLHQAALAAVTILSAHGDINIGRIEGAIRLTTLGRRAISTPQTAPSTTSPPLPPLRGRSIAGMIPR